MRQSIMRELLTKTDLAKAMELATLQLTVRLGIMNAALMTLLVALFGLMLKLR